MKTDIVYSDETLFIYLEGNMNKKEIKKLKDKMDNIINEYQINDIVLDTKNLLKNDSSFFNELISEYKSNEVVIKRIWFFFTFGIKYNKRGILWLVLLR